MAKRRTTAKAVNSDIESVAVDKLRSHPKNPRQGDVGAIHESIVENGFYGVIVAQKSTGYILAGNHRWQAAMEAGMKEVPVAWVNVDDDRAERILLADNRTNDLATYDDNALADILQDLAVTERELSGTGYDGDDLDDLMRRLSEDVARPDMFEEMEGEIETHAKCPRCGHRWRMGRRKAS